MRIRIRIHQLKLMRIHADTDTDPDPKPWGGLKTSGSVRCGSGSATLGSENEAQADLVVKGEIRARQGIFKNLHGIKFCQTEL